MTNDSPSTTTTTESGAFYRKVVRKGKKRRQKTIRLKKNEKKVILGKLGEMEVYIYPYDFPDKVFVGKFPVSTMMESAQWAEFSRISLRIKHYHDNHYYSEPKKGKGARATAGRIKKAYNLGLEEAKDGKKKRKKSRFL